jgi:hypothetical protein
MKTKEKKADLRRLFITYLAYFFAGSAAGAAAGAEAAGAAAGAEAASTAGAAAGAGAAACLPQADRDRANTAAIRADNFISFPSVDLKITGVLNLFGNHSLKSPWLRMGQYSTTNSGNNRVSKSGYKPSVVPEAHG